MCFLSLAGAVDDGRLIRLTSSNSAPRILYLQTPSQRTPLQGGVVAKPLPAVGPAPIAPRPPGGHMQRRGDRAPPPAPSPALRPGHAGELPPCYEPCIAPCARPRRSAPAPSSRDSPAGRPSPQPPRPTSAPTSSSRCARRRSPARPRAARRHPRAPDRARRAPHAQNAGTAQLLARLDVLPRRHRDRIVALDRRTARRRTATALSIRS